MTSGERRRFDQLKRAMVRAAIAENRAVIQGVRPALTRRRPTRWLRWASLAALVLAAAAGGLAPVFGRDEGRRPDSAAPRGASGSAGEASGRRLLPANMVAVDPGTFGLNVGRVVVDPGHGGDDPGAVASGLREKDLTLDIARRLRTALQAGGFEVVMTREGDERVPLRQRAQAANAARGDVFLSIHVNSIPAPERRGVETYVLGTTSDPRLAELSRAENAASGYSVADFRAVLEGVLRDARQQASERFGRAVQGRMYTALRASNEALGDRGVKQAPFVVLVGTEMPAVLAEVACLSSAEDAALLGEEDYRQRIADALAAGVREYAAACNGAARARNARRGE